MIVSFETDTKSLMLLVYASSRLSNDLATELFYYVRLKDDDLNFKAMELKIMARKIKHLSLSIIAMIDALNHIDDSQKVFLDVKEKASFNLLPSRQKIRQVMRR
jgi:hypothetical protein